MYTASGGYMRISILFIGRVQRGLETSICSTSCRSKGLYLVFLERRGHAAVKYHIMVVFDLSGALLFLYLTAVSIMHVEYLAK